MPHGGVRERGRRQRSILPLSVCCCFSIFFNFKMASMPRCHIAGHLSCFPGTLHFKSAVSSDYMKFQVSSFGANVSRYVGEGPSTSAEFPEKDMESLRRGAAWTSASHPAGQAEPQPLSAQALGRVACDGPGAGLLPLSGRPNGSFWLLTSAWSSLGHGRQLESEPAQMEDLFSSSFLLSVCHCLSSR